MTKLDLRVEIVSSSIANLSSMSQKSRLDILKVLSRYFTQVDIAIINNLSELDALVKRRPDLVFLGMKYIYATRDGIASKQSKIWLSEYLDSYEIAYTGSGRSAHELELDKSLAKRRVMEAGLNTPAFIVVGQNKTFNDEQDLLKLKFPVFIKPTDKGGGTGVDSNSLVYTVEQLGAKVKSISAAYHTDSLVEEYLPGREFSVALLESDAAKGIMSMPLELIAPLDKSGGRFLSSKIKREDLESFKPVAEADIKFKVTQLAVKAFRALGGRDYGRIDIRLNAHGEANFIEANLIPSLIKDYGNFPKACKLNMHMNYDSMILQIVNLALSHGRQSSVQQLTNRLQLAGPKIVPEFAQ